MPLKGILSCHIASGFRRFFFKAAMSKLNRPWFSEALFLHSGISGQPILPMRCHPSRNSKAFKKHAFYKALGPLGEKWYIMEVLGGCWMSSIEVETLCFRNKLDINLQKIGTQNSQKKD